MDLSRIFLLHWSIRPGEAEAIAAGLSPTIADADLRAAVVAWLTANRPGHPAIAALS